MVEHYFLALNETKPPHLYIIRWSGSRLHDLHDLHDLHAARYAERGGDSRKDADGYLNHHFPSVFFHHLLLLKGSTIFVWG